MTALDYQHISPKKRRIIMTDNCPAKTPHEHIRAVSWWLTYDDFKFPDKDIADKIRWKADNMAANGVNTAIVFGAHWRWDWMPVWTMLHDLIATVADACHQRGIKIYDHHSATLAQRYRTREDLRRIRLRHPHHISPAPTFDVGASWEYNGSKLDSWRMLNVTDGQVSFQPQYDTVEFCMNNPDFVSAYCRYVKLLFDETGVDGLSCDDGTFYSYFISCGCEHCRNRFRNEYGLALPPVDDLTFWGNWQNPDWRRWVDLRHATSGDFLQKVRSAMPPNAGLFACMSSASSPSANSCGQGLPMMDACNMLMMEMCKNMPDLNGDPTGPLPNQLFQAAYAEKRQIPLMSCGYAYTDASANVVWAFSKFIGIDNWLSTNKGRLSIRFSDWDKLPDDSELSGQAYRFERDNPKWFDTRSDADIKIYYSDLSRRYYGGGVYDFWADYQQAVLKLFKAGWNIGCAIAIPEPGECPALLLPSVAAISEKEIAAIEAFAAAGGKVLITGPCGLLDETGALRGQYTMRYGYEQQLSAWDRKPKFPTDWITAVPQEVLNPACWSQLAPGIFYHPVRFNATAFPDVAEVAPELPRFNAPGWMLRRQRDSSGAKLLHGFAADFEIGFDTAVEALRLPGAPWGNRIINSAVPRNAARHLELKLPNIANAELATPFDKEGSKLAVAPGCIAIDLPANCFYFILRYKQA